MFLHSLLFGKIMILLDPARLAFRTSFKSQVTIYQQLKSKRDYIVKGSNSDFIPPLPPKLAALNHIENI